MRRILATLLVVLLPLQWGWAAASATCVAGGSGVVAVQAHGAHDHGHGHGGAHGHPDGPSLSMHGVDAGDACLDPGLPVGDCAACHLPVAAFAAAVVPLPQACPGDRPGAGAATPVPEPPLQRPFRPPMTGA